MLRIKTPTAALSSVDRFREGIGERVCYLIGGKGCKPGLEIDHDVIRRRPSVRLSVVFANHPAAAISLNRAADPCRSGDSNSPRSARGNDRYADDAGGSARAVLQDGRKLIPRENPSFSTETSPGARLARALRGSGAGLRQAPRRWRPLARRLLITSLPPRDLMRTRNPCVLLLRRLFG